MAKYHIALVKVSTSSFGMQPVPDMEPVASEIIDTTTSKLSTIYPKDDTTYWVITPLGGVGGWVRLGAKGTAISAPAPVPTVNVGNPVLGTGDKAWRAPKFRRIGIEPMV